MIRSAYQANHILAMEPVNIPNTSQNITLTVGLKGNNGIGGNCFSRYSGLRICCSSQMLFTLGIQGCRKRQSLCTADG